MASNYDYETFSEQHKMQLVMSGVPSVFWQTLHEKLLNEKFDAGENFSTIFQSDGDEDDKLTDSIISEDGGQDQADVDFIRSKCGSISGSGSQKSKWKVIVSNQAGISATDGSKIFLVDHAWTFNPYDARKHLNHVRGLLGRISSLVDLEEESGNLKRDDLVDLVLSKLWLYIQTYTVNKDDLALEEKLSVWYVMDEFGSRIRHHDQPNFRVVPFYYAPRQMLYSLLFPLSDADFGDEVTRDFVEGTIYHKSEWRDFYLFPWYPRTMTHIPIEFSLPNDDYFQAYEHIPITELQTDSNKNGEKPSKILKIYAESDQITKHLNHPNFVIVQNEDEADILWLQAHYKDYKNLVSTKPHVMVNQFPYESVLTVKDLLAACIHLAYNDSPLNENTLEYKPYWFCTTFNLRTELPQFVSYFQKREERDLDNTWIIKPWNLARSLDTFVTNDLKQIIRLIDSGPKIACKYIDDPVLFLRPDNHEWVKFDLRFIVLLRSVRPLKLYVFNPFWLRFALKPFSLDSFDDFEKHFTVFNYLDKDKILQMRCEKFVEHFTEQYPYQAWDEVLKSTYKAIKEVFEVACKFDPPKGLAPLPQCRAMYGIDTMLKWTTDEETGQKIMQPVVLEVNFMPDCARACDYYPDFANTVFQTLFLDDVPKDLPITLL